MNTSVYLNKKEILALAVFAIGYPLEEASDEERLAFQSGLQRLQQAALKSHKGLKKAHFSADMTSLDPEKEALKLVQSADVVSVPKVRYDALMATLDGLMRGETADGPKKAKAGKTVGKKVKKKTVSVKPSDAVAEVDPDPVETEAESVEA